MTTGLRCQRSNEMAGLQIVDKTLFAIRKGEES